MPLSRPINTLVIHLKDELKNGLSEEISIQLFKMLSPNQKKTY